MLTFHQLNLEHAPDFDVLAQHVALSYEELFGPDAVPSERRFESLAEQIRRHSPPHWAFVGSEGRRDVAFVTLGESFAVRAGGTYGIINDLWVHPDRRDQGLGARVIDHCVGFGRKRCWRRLDVSAPPAALAERGIAFFEKRGFELTGHRLAYSLE